MKKKDNGSFLTSLIVKKWSTSQNYMEWARTWSSKSETENKLSLETLREKNSPQEGHHMMAIKWTVLFKMLGKDPWSQCRLINISRTPMLPRQLSWPLWRQRAMRKQRLIWCCLRRTGAREHKSWLLSLSEATIVKNTIEKFFNIVIMFLFNSE